jgi:hypothetical protein
MDAHRVLYESAENGSECEDPYSEERYGVAIVGASLRRLRKRVYFDSEAEVISKYVVGMCIKDSMG